MSCVGKNSHSKERGVEAVELQFAATRSNSSTRLERLSEAHLNFLSGVTHSVCRLFGVFPPTRVGQRSLESPTYSPLSVSWI
jgi:hypothetical protein